MTEAKPQRKEIPDIPRISFLSIIVPNERKQYYTSRTENILLTKDPRANELI